MITIEVINNDTTTGYVHLLEEVKDLRINHGIVGRLSSTLPSATQQNTFLYLPLILSHEEMSYLVKNGVAVLSNREVITSNRDVIDANNHQKREEEDIKNNNIVIINDTGSQVTKDNNTTIINNELKTCNCNTCQVFEKLKTEANNNNNNDTVLVPGGRFGGKWTMYPGDPLRVHSNGIIQAPIGMDDKIDLRHLQSMARLGTTVRKASVQPAVSNQKDLSSSVELFTFEWSGFG